VQEGKGTVYRIFATLLLPILLCSCIDEVYWTRPISDIQNAEIDERLFGSWRLKSMEIYLHIGKGDESSMDFVCQEMSGELKSFHGIMHISTLGRRAFLNTRLFDPQIKGIPEAYLIAEYEIKGKENLIMYFPDRDYIKEAIETKMLSGEIAGGSSGPIIVRSDSQQIKGFLRNSPHWIFSKIKNFERLKF
jgi:hypothetical protein